MNRTHFMSIHCITIIEFSVTIAKYYYFHKRILITKTKMFRWVVCFDCWFGAIQLGRFHKLWVLVNHHYGKEEKKFKMFRSQITSYKTYIDILKRFIYEKKIGNGINDLL